MYQRYKILILVWMKSLFYTCLCGLFLFSCVEPEDAQYSGYTPLLMSRTQLESSISFKEARPMANPGKIYIKDHYIFINERYKGVHIIDNSDPSFPVNIGFIVIPGCIDMAAKGTTLYTDNAVDLVALEISDLQHLQVTKRVKNTFPEFTPPDELRLPEEYKNRPQDLIVVGWQTK